MNQFVDRDTFHRLLLVVAICVHAPAISSALAGEIERPVTSDDFFYPKAKSALVNLPFPRAEKGAWSTALSTDDEPEKITRWYWSQFGLGDPVEKNSTTGIPSGIRKRQVGPMRQVVTMLSWNVPIKKGERRLRLYQFVVQETGGARGDFVLSLAIHRREDPGQSEILLSFIPLK